jgi:dTDP-glucose 4,6-dehydratase
MKTILITGGAGFIGSHLCDFYTAEGWRVLCLDNLITGSLDNIAGHKRDARFHFIRHDITRPIHIAGPVDLVLNFASPASPVDYMAHPLATLKVGSAGTHNCLGLAKTKKSRFLLASTSEVYGDPKVHPQTEKYWGHVNPIGPRSVYDEAKRFAEAITMAYHRVHRVDTRIIRIFNTYGPRMQIKDGRAIPNFLSQALRGEPITVYGTGKQTRSFCYVSDLVRGIVALSRATTSDPVNVGNPAEMSLKDLALKIKKMTGSKSRIVYKPLPQDDPKQRRPDITRAKKLLKWTPKVPLDVGLAATIEYFREHID